jgi:hypothetical protein
MAGISDRALTTAYGRLASLLGVSLASARRKVDIRAARDGIRDSAGKLALAEQLLAEAEASGHDNHTLLTSLLEAVGSDENFMVED